jgi:hypothetical protein
VGCYVSSFDLLREAGVFGVHACVHLGVGRIQRFSCHVKQLRNLEALVSSTDITRLPSVLIMNTTDESGKVQVATFAARVNIWTISNVMDTYPNLAAISTAPIHHAGHKLRFVLQLAYVRECVHYGYITLHLFNGRACARSHAS